jgi:hypothetical protein
LSCSSHPPPFRRCDFSRSGFCSVRLHMCSRICSLDIEEC